ncbi:hypothetical protein [Erythrobacter litoralis]|uniref:Terminase n=1 Tax=Erythrobacter litoralis (strain HTCC2594) TaxID=314225 RepID=Q2N5Z0_ERYLH|nr:hypothetical protein [Erythrobacter litoralis]ABC64901.1 hypothetical protein ELI_14045 [Erythrobacter litoralis HTCC2594]
MAKKNWKTIFIDQLAETSNVKAACEVASVSQSLVYKTRRHDAEFARQWYAALAEGYDNLEMELLGRLRDGRLEDVDEHGTRRKFDIGTAFRCLAAHRDTVAKERGRQTLEDEVATMKSINAKIDKLRDNEERAARARAAREKRAAEKSR